ncbi:MAG TPA: DUF2892 domain-containing protein [Bacteroidales bacterium]|nr:DUF2892 domain-containing protein [Bacteroidales bacterium]HPS17603.1 DUF2892 domain-containing protein [Bacteroidales bacterium]
MKKNMGSTDRIIRSLVAIILAILIITGVLSGIAAIILGILSAILMVTAILGFCPLYILFGLHTLRTRTGIDS